MAFMEYSCSPASLNGTGNITDDPLFVDPLGDDFNLQEDSPCIDTGNPASPLDPDDTRADMGALYYDQSTGIIEEAPPGVPKIFVLHPPHPNPFNPLTTLSFDLPAASWVLMEIYDLSSRRITTLINGWRTVGRHDVTFVANSMASGVYIYRLHAGDFTASGKMILMK